MNFRFRWIPFIAALIVATIGISLGQWQTRRATEKEAIQAKLARRQSQAAIPVEEAALLGDESEFRRVRARGEFVRAWPVYLDNRPHGGIAGFHVLMPFRLAESDKYVLVARGWVARDPRDRLKLPPLDTPPGDLEIEGIARRNPGRVMELGTEAPLQPGAIVQNAEIGEFAEAGKFAMLPLMVEQTSESGDGLVRDWPLPSSGVEKHRGYAFQWNALAATALIFFIVTGFRRERQ